MTTARGFEHCRAYSRPSAELGFFRLPARARARWALTRLRAFCEHENGIHLGPYDMRVQVRFLSPENLLKTRDKYCSTNCARAPSPFEVDGGKRNCKRRPSAGGHCTTRARLWAGQRSGALWRGCPGAPRDFWSKSVFLGGSGWKASLVRVEKCRPGEIASRRHRQW